MAERRFKGLFSPEANFLLPPPKLSALRTPFPAEYGGYTHLWRPLLGRKIAGSTAGQRAPTLQQCEGKVSTSDPFYPFGRCRLGDCWSEVVQYGWG